MDLAKPRPAQQERSRRTRDRLMAAGHKLLKTKSWEDLSVSGITKAAGCSVGSFYARYGSKDEYFEALCADFLEKRRQQFAEYWDSLPADADLAEALVVNVVSSVIDHHNLWQAALKRSTIQPDFWSPFRETGLMIFNNVVAHRERQTGKPVSDEEKKRIRFAQLLLNGYINNSIIVRPGPFAFDDKEQIEELSRAIHLVAGF